MAFGFPPKFTNSILLNGMSPQVFINIAARAGQDLGWSLIYINENSILFQTKFSWASWSEEVRIRVSHHEASMESRCKGGQVVDWGKNSKNLDQFLVRFYELKEQPPTENEPVEDLPGDFLQSVTADDGTAYQNNDRGAIALLIPTKHYFVTPLIVLLNIAFFIVMIASGVHIFEPDAQEILNWGGNLREPTMHGEWWRLFYSCFIHIGVVHLLFNMIALLYIGMLLEPALGWLRFLMAYVLAGLIGSAASIWWHHAVVSAGASGAIFGLYGVFLAMLTTNIVDKKARTIFLTSTLLFVGYNLVAGLKGGIDNAAHIGGLLGGLLIGYIYYPGLKRQSEPKLKYATLVAAVLLSGILLFSFNRRTPKGGFAQYKERMESFASMEAVAMSSVYDMGPEISDDEKIYAIREHGLVYWKKCQDELEEIDRLDLPAQALQLNKLMKRYCKKRIEGYHLMYRALVENTKKYQPEIDAYEKEIADMTQEASLLS